MALSHRAFRARVIGPVAPSWYAPLTANAGWYAFPSSQYVTSSAVRSAGAQQMVDVLGGSNTLPDHAWAYSGGALVEQGIFDHTGTFIDGTFLGIPFNAGHSSGWPGGDFPAFGPLSGNTPIWRAVSPPNSPAITNSQGARATVNGGQGVIGRHSYDTVKYLRGINQVISAGCAAAGDGSAEQSSIFAAVDRYDMSLAGWTTRRYLTGPDTNAISAFDQVAWVDNQRSFVYTMAAAGGQIRRVEISSSMGSSSWTNFKTTGGIGSGYNVSGPAAAFDESRNIAVIVMASETNGPFEYRIRAIDCSETTSDWHDVLSNDTGGGSLPALSKLTITQDPVAGCFLVWFENDRDTVWELRPPAGVFTGSWSWTRITPSVTITWTNRRFSSELGFPAFYGRFAYCNNPRGVVFSDNGSSNVKFWKRA